MRDAAAPARSRVNANPAGGEVTSTPVAGQFPFVRETPTAHLRNALACAQLLDLDPSRGTLARAIADMATRIGLALEQLEITDRQTLPEPQRVAAELVKSIGRAAAADLNRALEAELYTGAGFEESLAEMDRTNGEIRRLALVDDAPAELDDADRRDDATGVSHG